MLAAAGGHVDVLKTLIENKADVNMLTKVHNYKESRNNMPMYGYVTQSEP